ncbi:MAG: CHAP domain-containing protein [Hyphomonadaceae bacterium]
MGWARSLLAAGLTGAALAACAPIEYASVPQPGLPRNAPPSYARPQPLPNFDPNGAPTIVRDGPRLQCVPFARGLSGIQIYGDANTWWAQAAGRYPRGGIPSPGSVFVLRGYNNPGRGHVAVVTAIVGPREIRVDQANWLNGGEVTVRVPVLDVSPNNDWTQIRMWHIPTQAWGARIYEAEGFIHPLPLTYAAAS